MTLRPGAAELDRERAPVRVMVVDDSTTVRILVSHWLDAEAGLSVVARHANGQLAVDAIAANAPDVIVLDLEMPVMDGLTALPRLRRACPGARIIVLSTLTQRNAEISLRALALGAADYVPKPSAGTEAASAFAFREELIRKVTAIGRRRLPHARPDPARAVRLAPFSSVPPGIIAIGSSTGGPQALTTVIGSLGGVLRQRPMVVAQHMPATITAMLAQHLGRAAGHRAKEAEHGEPLLPGTIYVAPGAGT